MGYTFFRVCRVSNKAAGVFFIRQCERAINKQVFRGKTDVKKIEIKFCTAAIAKFKHCVFASFWLSFAIFGTRLVRKPHPSRQKKSYKQKFFAQNHAWGDLWVALRKPLACYRVLVYPKLAPRLQKTAANYVDSV